MSTTAKQITRAALVPMGGKFTKELDNQLYTRVERTFPLPYHDGGPSRDHVFAVGQDNKLYAIHPDNSVILAPEIDKRKAAADKWAEWYFPMKSKSEPIKALLVIVGTKAVRDYLAEHDPMSLKQSQEAVSGKSYIDFLER